MINEEDDIHDVVPSEEDDHEQKRSKTELIQQFLNVQEKELNIRSDEIALQKSDLDNQKELASQSIDAQVKDRSRERRYMTIESILTKVFVLLIVGGILFFLDLLVEKGQKDLASEVLKFGLAVIPSALGGYGFGYLKGNQRNQSQTDD